MGSLMDPFHLSIPLYENREKLNGPMVNFSISPLPVREFVLREEAACRPPPTSAQVATKVSL